MDAGSWRLRVGGLVERELELSYRQLLGLGLVELDATLICVHDPVGGRRVGTARWLGVPVGDLLGLAGVRPGAELGPELAPTAWRQWRLDWQATPGAHRLRVRAEGRQGLQPTRQAPTYPAGATGLHTVSVRVVPATAANGGRARPTPLWSAGRPKRKPASGSPLAAWRHGGPRPGRGVSRPRSARRPSCAPHHAPRRARPRHGLGSGSH